MIGSDASAGSLGATGSAGFGGGRETGGPAAADPDGIVGAVPSVVVLCAPGGRNAAYWPGEWVAELTALGHLVVRFDSRYQGRSEAPADFPDPEQAAEVMAEDLVGLCRHLAQDQLTERTDPGTGVGVRLTLVGVGLGGWVAARAASGLGRLGLRPGRLVLVGTSCWFADPTMPGPIEPLVVALVMRRRGSGPNDLLRALSREVSAERGGSGPLDGEPLRRRVQTWLDHGFNAEDPYWAHWLAAPPLTTPATPAAVPDPVGLLAERIVVMHGEADPVVPLAHGQRLGRAFGVPVQVIDGAGHHVEGPMLRAIAAALMDWDDPQG